MLAGLSLLSWAFLGIMEDYNSSGVGPVRMCTALINALLGIIFLVRKPIIKHGSSISFFLSLPSLLASGLAFSLAQPTIEWPHYAVGLFVVGSLIAALSFLYLGRCFAIFPAVRGVVISGPYRFVRHPAYLGELFIVCACLLVNFWLLIIPVICVIAGIVVRISIEEKMLLGNFKYQAYANQVAWRLVPRVW